MVVLVRVRVFENLMVVLRALQPVNLSSSISGDADFLEVIATRNSWPAAYRI